MQTHHMLTILLNNAEWGHVANTGGSGRAPAKASTGYILATSALGLQGLFRWVQTPMSPTRVGSRDSLKNFMFIFGRDLTRRVVKVIHDRKETCLQAQVLTPA
eukprot:9481868-Pyramimonas_sp.AAC.2